MIDPISGALRALAARNAWAPALAFAAGSVASFGPCVAPRMLAVAALTVNRPVRETAGIVAVFTAGILTGYSLLVVSGAFLWQAAKYSGYVYVALATSMAAAGIVALVRDPACNCRQGALRGQTHSVFFLGAASVATVSPCCMPVIAAAALYAQGTGLAFAWLVVVSFALGHALPLALAAAGSRSAGRNVFGGHVSTATRIVTGALMLGGAGFYYVLA